eukprot:2752125-Amphidinium_carterae.1
MLMQERWHRTLSEEPKARFFHQAPPPLHHMGPQQHHWICTETEAEQDVGVAHDRLSVPKDCVYTYCFVLLRLLCHGSEL